METQTRLDRLLDDLERAISRAAPRTSIKDLLNELEALAYGWKVGNFATDEQQQIHERHAYALLTIVERARKGEL